MAKHTFGLENVYMGDVAADGGIGTNLTPVGETVSGTMDMTTSEPTITDFNIEESDSPVESIVSTPGKIELNWSTYDVSGDNLEKFFGGTYSGIGGIATLGSLTPGSGYTTDGTYNNVPLTGGAGTGATANITIASGAVTDVTIVKPGSGYDASDALSADSADLGGNSGTAFSQVVGTVSASASWEAPDSMVEKEQSLKVIDKKGNIVEIPRAKISANMGISFSKEKLGQVDIKATILQPTKSGVRRMKITYPSA